MNEKIKEIRKSLGLNQEDFGRRVGVTVTAISKIEKGINCLTEQMFLAVCREFNVNEEWLRTGVGEMFQHDPATEIDALAEKYDLSAFDKRLIAEYASLTEEQRKAVNRFVEKLYAGSSMEAAKEIASPVQKPLSIDEKVKLYRARLEADEKGPANSMIFENSNLAEA